VTIDENPDGGAVHEVTAARLHELGQPLALERVHLPPAADGEMLVELLYAGINPVDGYMIDGRVAAEGPRPRTLGSEATGTVDGRPVLVAGGGLGSSRDGVWASAAVVPAAAVIELPDGVDLRQGAAMGVVGLTAYKCVREVAAVGERDRVLVLGASGGVGSAIVSFARAQGARVVGQTGNPDKAVLISEQGAERVIVCDADGLSEAIAELQPTVVFDPLGGGFLAPAVEALAPRGRIVSFGTSAGAQVSFNLQTLYRKSGSISGYGGLGLGDEERRQGLQAALQALAQGELRIAIGEVLPLSEVNRALERFARREVSGKLLLDLRA
jgi:NADPH2:quinone reductase